MPQGHAAVTPQLALTYSSGGGASLAGIGWAFPTASIERFTARGLPDYDADDRISVGPSQELVRVSSSGDLAFYRARFEGDFVRYAWHDVDDGRDGYWTAEDPDGTISYFGANKDGVLSNDSRLRGDEGTFRWLVRESVDVFGHRLIYSWSTHGGSVPLLDKVEYAFTDDATATGAQARITFRYELRPDLLSDARGGFEELIAHRLVGVDVFARGERVRGYDLAYEDFDDAGGISRLASSTRTGSDGSIDPVHHAFRYSQGLGGSCTGESCEDPQLVSMGSLGVNLANGTATLIDMNGDGVPDVLEAAAGQPHRIHLSELDENGRHTWRAPVTSSLAGTSAHALSSPFVQPLDVDGDGFVDLLNAQSGDVLRNLGAGDWSRIEPVAGDTSSLLTELSTDLGKIRFLDADLDRRIDVLRADATGTTLYRNTGDGGFVVDVDVDDIGAGFEEDNLELADMNGDGLLDPVKLLVGEVQFRVNLGRGRFSEFRTIENAPITSADLAFTSLQDLNGDGIEDIVIVSADQVRYALNRNAASFEEVATITDAGGAALPTRDATTTVLFADMNANGSDDVVWIDPAGNTTYLELCPVRPNLITHIENGVGMNVDITYVSSALVRARNPLAWQHATPSSMLVVDTRDTWALLDVDTVEQHDLRRFDYQNSFYD
ncbi:MAG TPA: FG-GAP-like repeat-containing protein, partial [Myxococcota bacterium]